MRKNSAKLIFYFGVVFIISIIFLARPLEFEGNKIELYLDKSGPYIGANFPSNLGFNGTGIKIAVIDTGVDYNHPDLYGYGPDGKVVGGYDYIDNDNFPLDTNGHGTEVAGIIAANGQLKGIAPESKILAYRVSDNGESVSSDLIIKAIRQAIADGADIINISLGVNQTNYRIDQSVNDATNKGIVVVAAAGNNGPQLSTIGSPGINPNVITVGATYNDISSSLVSTFEVRNQQFQVIPMIGTQPLDEPISAKIIYGGYGREKDLADLDVTDSIVLVERGSDNEEEIVYFSDKERNAANKGAAGLIVYNKEPEIFFGELVHEFIEPGYKPKIPTVSMSGKDGIPLRDSLQNNTTGTLHIFNNPDFVASFSSRGPVSSFYMKPDMVAPGVFINTTLINAGYNVTSGTSYATPHVAGAAALLLQKDNSLKPYEIKSLLVTTSDPVSDTYGKEFPSEIGGAGRLNVTKAMSSNLILTPSHLKFFLSLENQTQSKTLSIKSFSDKFDNLDIKFEFPEESIDFNYSIDDDKLHVTALLEKENFGGFDGRLIIHSGQERYRIPILVLVTNGTIAVNQENGELNFDIVKPKDWTYAKISLIHKESGKIATTSITPTKESSVHLYDIGEYWVEAKIESGNETIDAFDTVIVNNPTTENAGFFELIEIPEKILLIILVIIAAIVIFGLKTRKR